MSRLAELDRPDESRSPAQDRAAEVLVTAADLIHRNGFDATSMNDIARAVHLTKAGLYYYTKGKNDLLFKIISFAMDCVERDIVTPAEKIDDPEDRLGFIIAAHLKTIIDSGGAITVLTDEVNKLEPDQRQQIVERKRRYFDFVCQTLRDLEQRGRLRSVDISIAALNMFAAILGLVRWHNPEGRMSSDEVVTEITNFILSGLLRE